MFPRKTKTAGWSNSRVWNFPRQTWPSAGYIRHSTVLFSLSWSQPEVTSSFFSSGSSKSCFWLCESSSHGTSCHPLSLSHLQWWSLRTVLMPVWRPFSVRMNLNNCLQFFTWFSVICAFRNTLFRLWLYYFLRVTVMFYHMYLLFPTLLS